MNCLIYVSIFHLALQIDIVNTQLLYLGKLVLKNTNGTEVWNGFNNSHPTNTLLGQGMYRSQAQSLILWLKNGNLHQVGNNVLYNLGYPTMVPCKTIWTPFFLNQTIEELPKPPTTKDNNLVKILVSVINIPRILLIVVVFFGL